MYLIDNINQIYQLFNESKKLIFYYKKNRREYKILGILPKINVDFLKVNSTLLGHFSFSSPIKFEGVTMFMFGLLVEVEE
jgi:hypothetical protein